MSPWSGSRRASTIKRTKHEVLLGSCRGALLHLTGLSAFMGENTGGLVGKLPREAGEFTDECAIENV